MSLYALLSLYRSLTRHKLQAALTIGGLGVGIAVFLVLGLYVRFETSYETWLPRHDRVYLVQTELRMPGGAFNGAYPSSMAGMLEEMRDDFPNVVGTRLRGGRDGGNVLREGGAIKEDVAQVDPNFFDLFDLPMVAGDGKRALADPSAALISRSAARRYFGAMDPVGQTMTVSVDSPAVYRVAGIFEDLPANTDLRFSILLTLPKTPPPGQWAWYKWGTGAVATFLRFETPGLARDFQRRLPAFVERRASKDFGPGASKFLTLSLLPIDRTHLEPVGATSAGRKAMVATLAIVALMTLLIAIVNYVNLATAQAGLRAREVSMRKVLGADRPTLIRQFLGEALLTVAASALLGLILTELSLPWLNRAGALSLSIPYGEIVPALLVLTVLVGLAAGFYPALMLSRFPAAEVLASAQAPGGGRSGARLRQALVLVQFGLATAFIAGTFVLGAQARHVRNADLGFRREGLLTIPSLADTGVAPELARSLLATFRGLPGVVSLGVGDSGPGDGEFHIDVMEMPGQPNASPTVRMVAAGPGFFQTYRPRLLAGRLFDDAHDADDSTDFNQWSKGRNIIVDREMLSLLGFRSPAEAIGKTVGGPRPRTIIGVVDRLRFFSPRTPTGATYFIYYRDLPPTPVAAIRFTGDPHAMLKAVRTAWLRLAPDVPLRADLAETRLAEYYDADDQAARLLAIGGTLAVLVACIGLWGLAAFDTARRVKEIGIRKALGASSRDIVLLLVGQFMRPVLLANAIAWPLAWFAARKWLAGFGDRIALSPFYFLAASLAAIAVALLTVLGQSRRASRAAPGWTLRHE